MRTAKRQTRATWVSVVIGALALAVAIAVPLLLATRTTDDDLAGAGEKAVTARTHELHTAVWVTEKPVEALGVPPRFEPDIHTQESHCGDWVPWLQSVGASGSSGVVYLDVKAPADAPVVVMDVRFTIHDHRPLRDVTVIQCLYGAGGYDNNYALLDFDAPHKPLEVSSEDDASSTTYVIPPDQFRVEAGFTEVIAIHTKGTPGFYEWSATVSTIIDQEEHEIEIGSATDPVLTFVDESNSILDPDHYVDWDVNACRWVGARAIQQRGPTGSWACG